jgi:hypothetical protein
VLPLLKMRRLRSPLYRPDSSAYMASCDVLSWATNARLRIKGQRSSSLGMRPLACAALGHAGLRASESRRFSINRIARRKSSSHFSG